MVIKKFKEDAAYWCVYDEAKSCPHYFKTSKAANTFKVKRKIRGYIFQEGRN